MSALERLMGRPSRTDSVTLTYDPNVAAAIDQARTDVVAASGAELVEAQARLAALEAQRVTIRFDLEGIGATRQHEIINQHLDAGDKKRTAATGPSWDAWLLAEVCKVIVLSDALDEPLTGLVPEQMERILDRLSLDDRSEVTARALRLDRVSSIVGDRVTP